MIYPKPDGDYFTMKPLYALSLAWPIGFGFAVGAMIGVCTLVMLGKAVQWIFGLLS